ncbi:MULTISPECIES: hypothetical protein [Bifidobacterium]|uniref:Uncharacterized protein n=1 Tax=Bifidobacterium vansinderenii TaxID=1984871 RepID=A0A229VYY0_9BIFI|nr:MULTISPECIES: hypothetical protein [Bifidobacterium]OXN00828.1 hypothetical protein Tam10B_0784 [Bifidobacterium vansinderenii]
MSFKNSMIRGLALYGASTMTATPSASKEIFATLRSLENDAR